MELLCPNCQKKLTVPDQYAGQVMKCPLCAGTFTTPSLPAAPGPAFVAPPMPVVPPPPIAPDPLPVPVTPLPPRSDNLSFPAGNVELVGAPPAGGDMAPISKSAAPQPVTGDYRHRLTAWLSPRVLPWITVGALGLVFVLTIFFTWVGFYPGGVHIASQNAWGAAFGSYAVAPDWEGQTPFGKEAKELAPGGSPVLIFFLLLLVVALLTAGAAVAMEKLTLPLPPWTQQLKPWRWAIVSALTLLAFVFLLLQMVSGFGLANKARHRADTELDAKVKEFDTKIKEAPAAEKKAFEDEKKSAEVYHGEHLASVKVTAAFCLSLWLTLLALVCAALTFWLGRRPGYPLPRLEVMW